MPRYKHLFFDLDHTLWDTDRNSKESLNEICNELSGEYTFPPFDDFLSCYRSHNEKLWGLYSENLVGREAVRINRFRFTLEDFSIYSYPLAEKMADEFIKRTPCKGHLMEDALEVLDQLASRYHMSIITNGFKESQQIKLATSGLTKYFKKIFISEEVGFNKPDPRVFAHALLHTGTHVSEAIMIGDTYETDIAGAHAAGIDQVYLKANPLPSHSATFNISKLKELLNII